MSFYNVEVIGTKSGHHSARVTFFDYTFQKQTQIYLCSKVNPIKEAENWACNVYEDNVECFIVYGLGLGYHVEALISLMKKHQKIYVIDTNQQVVNDLRQYTQRIQSEKVKYIITKDLNKIRGIFEQNNNINVRFEIYIPCMKLIPKDVAKLREIFESNKIRKLNTESYQNQIRCNYKYHSNKEYPNVCNFYDGKKNKPIFIISAGPSLDENIEYLKQVGKDAMIFSTGRALKALIENHIRVDMFCIIDPTESTLSQIEGIEGLDIPFVFLNTAYYETIERYAGPKYIAYSMDSHESQKGRIETGGSVATAILDLAIKFGGNPIVFVGQDLAYTNGLSHCKAAGATATVDDDNMKKVKNTQGVYIPTTSSLLSFRHWIQNKIKKHPEITFYNCSEGGAFIEGCIHCTLNQLIDKLKLKSIEREE